jgi:hypothetical protein
MPASTTDKLTAVIVQIAAQGNAEVLRLTVPKKWFERPGRLPAFALWVASRAVEQGRYSWHADSPSLGYKLAVDYSAHYDPRYGTGLNGPSRDRLQELVDFIRHREALEAAAAEDVHPVKKVQ